MNDVPAYFAFQVPLKTSTLCYLFLMILNQDLPFQREDVFKFHHSPLHKIIIMELKRNVISS